MNMIKWWKKYRLCKALGIRRPFKASLDKNFMQMG